MEEEWPEKKVRLAKRAVIDVISSVKGGSGKSTFSLLLAAYYNSKPGSVAYVLDLDLRGTSWEKNYGRYMSTPFFEADKPEDRNSLWDYYNAGFEELRAPLSEDAIALNKDICIKREHYNNYPFMNTLKWDFGYSQSKGSWTEIPFKTALGEGAIKLYPARTSNGTDLDQLETEIFENTIYQGICHILNRHRSNESLEEVHIILDMPPSYEKCAEAVLKHLLVNEESDLFQSARKRENQFDVSMNDEARYYLPYELRLYMMCTRNPAHVEQNGIYLCHWLERRKYSDAIIDLIKDKEAVVKFLSDKPKVDGESGKEDKLGKEITSVTEPISRFLVRFIINDVSGNFWKSKEGRKDTSKPEFEQYAAWAKTYFAKKETESSSFYTQARKSFNKLAPDNTDIITFCAFPQIDLPATYWEMEAETAPSKQIIEIEAGKINPLEYVKMVIM